MLLSPINYAALTLILNCYVNLLSSGFYYLQSRYHKVPFKKKKEKRKRMLFSLSLKCSGTFKLQLSQADLMTEWKGRA